MPSSSQSYVLGFAFSEDGKNVLVIKKTKPEWQAGKFNGIGGKVEPFEAYSHAMVREFREETGLYTFINQWDYLGVMRGTDYKGGEFSVYVYSTFQDLVRLHESPTEEAVQLIPVAELDRYPHIPNLDWLIPMALNKKAEGNQISRLREFEAHYA